jgi:hypothetical protein
MPKRQIIIRDGVAYVPLTKGCEAAIDIADIPRVEAWSWTALEGRHTTYARRAVLVGSGYRTVYLHCAIWGETLGLEIDHIDGNGLNNQRSNLRLATHSENMRNQRLSRNSSSGLKGASWSKSNQRWQAQITIERKHCHLGFYDTPEEAHEAYARASVELHGQFGRVS